MSIIVPMSSQDDGDTAPPRTRRPIPPFTMPPLPCTWGPRYGRARGLRNRGCCLVERGLDHLRGHAALHPVRVQLRRQVQLGVSGKHASPHLCRGVGRRCVCWLWSTPPLWGGSLGFSVRHPRRVFISRLRRSSACFGLRPPSGFRGPCPKNAHSGLGSSDPRRWVS